MFSTERDFPCMVYSKIPLITDKISQKIMYQPEKLSKKEISFKNVLSTVRYHSCLSKTISGPSGINLFAFEIGTQFFPKPLKIKKISFLIFPYCVAPLSRPPLFSLPHVFMGYKMRDLNNIKALQNSVSNLT